MLEKNPDFTTKSGRIDLLELMMRQKDWNDFYKWASDHKGIFDYNSQGTVFIKLSTILEPEKLVDAIIEWLEAKHAR